MFFVGFLATPALSLGSGRVSMSLPIHFMHADGVCDNIRQARLVCLSMKLTRFTRVE